MRLLLEVPHADPVSVFGTVTSLLRTLADQASEANIVAGEQNSTVEVVRFDPGLPCGVRVGERTCGEMAYAAIVGERFGGNILMLPVCQTCLQTRAH